jgi:hypothetical protein
MPYREWQAILIRQWLLLRMDMSSLGMFSGAVVKFPRQL